MRPQPEPGPPHGTAGRGPERGCRLAHVAGWHCRKISLQQRRRQAPESRARITLGTAAGPARAAWPGPGLRGQPPPPRRLCRHHGAACLVAAALSDRLAADAAAASAAKSVGMRRKVGDAVALPGPRQSRRSSAAPAPRGRGSRPSLIMIRDGSPLRVVSLIKVAPRFRVTSRRYLSRLFHSESHLLLRVA